MTLKSTGSTRNDGSNTSGGAQRNQQSGTDVDGEEKNKTEEDHNEEIPVICRGGEAEQQEKDGGATDGRDEGSLDTGGAAGNNAEENKVNRGHWRRRTHQKIW